MLPLLTPLPVLPGEYNIIAMQINKLDKERILIWVAITVFTVEYTSSNNDQNILGP